MSCLIFISKLNNLKINKSTEIARQLNLFLVDSVNKINEGAPNISYDDNIRESIRVFEFKQIDETKLVKVIKAEMFLDCKEVIFPILINIISSSLMKSVFKTFLVVLDGKGKK